ncbi:MAG: prenyltransferase, partial [Candidatus Omnitrophica bacterium]|nr:prenyltransferase [Candidatus Omnitrophota bacterium]
PALVMGGYFIQTGIFPDLRSFVLSLSFGLFTSTILFANEVPDFAEDKKSGKNNLVSVCGVEKAYLGYYMLIASGLLSIFAALALGYLGIVSILSLLIIFPAIKTGKILKNYYSDKLKLISSSKITINIQMLSGMILILSLWL